MEKWCQRMRKLGSHRNQRALLLAECVVSGEEKSGLKLFWHLEYGGKLTETGSSSGVVLMAAILCFFRELVPEFGKG